MEVFVGQAGTLQLYDVASGQTTDTGIHEATHVVVDGDIVAYVAPQGVAYYDVAAGESVLTPVRTARKLSISNGIIAIDDTDASALVEMGFAREKGRRLAALSPCRCQGERENPGAGGLPRALVAHHDRQYVASRQCYCTRRRLEMHPSTYRAPHVSAALLMALGIAGSASPARAQTTLFSDSFNRTNGLGGNWSVASGQGSFSTDGSFAVSGPATPAGVGNWAKVVPALGTADYAVQCDLVVPSGTAYSGIFARSAGSDVTSDLYDAQLSAATGAVNLYRRNGYGWTLLSSVPAGIVANTRYTVKLVTTGSSPVHLEVWLNGSRQIAYDDSSPSRIGSGVPGMQNYDPNVKYDNFSVTTGGSSSGAPTIASFSPASGGRGDTVSIAGTGFTGTTFVTVGGVSAAFAALSSTSIVAVVPSGAGTGAISVTTPAGTATSSATFTFAANANVLASNDPNLPVGSFVGTDPDAGDPTIMTFANEGGSRVSLAEVGSASHFIQAWNTRWTTAPTLNTPYRFSARLAAGSRTSASVQLQTYGAAWPTSTFDLTTCTATDANGAVHTAAAVSGQANTCDVTVTASFVSTTMSHAGASWNAAIVTASGTPAAGKALYVENAQLQPATGSGTTPPPNGTTPWAPAPGDPSWVNVRSFGAVGDAVADDTQAFRNAAATGKNLYVPAPPVAYKLTGVVQLVSSVYGDGSMPEIRMYGADGDPNQGQAHNIFYVSGYQGPGLVINGLHLNGQWDGTGTNGEWSHGVNIAASSNVTVQYCTIERAYGDDIFIGEYTTTMSNHIVIQNDTLIGPRRCNIAVDGGTNIIIRNNSIVKTTSDYVAAIDLETDGIGFQLDRFITIDNNAFNVIPQNFSLGPISLYSPVADPPSSDVAITNNHGTWTPSGWWLDPFNGVTPSPTNGIVSEVQQSSTNTWTNLTASNNVHQ